MATVSTALEILEQCKHFFSKNKGYCEGHYAEDLTGIPVEPTDDSAVRYNLPGYLEALYKCYDEYDVKQINEWVMACNYLNRANLFKMGDGKTHPFIERIDDKNATAPYVGTCEAIKKAITLCKKEYS